MFVYQESNSNFRCKVCHKNADHADMQTRTFCTIYHFAKFKTQRQHEYISCLFNKLKNFLKRMRKWICIHYHTCYLLSCSNIRHLQSIKHCCENFSHCEGIKFKSKCFQPFLNLCIYSAPPSSPFICTQNNYCRVGTYHIKISASLRLIVYIVYMLGLL